MCFVQAVLELADALQWRLKQVSDALQTERNTSWQRALRPLLQYDRLILEALETNRAAWEELVLTADTARRGHAAPLPAPHFTSPAAGWALIVQLHRCLILHHQRQLRHHQQDHYSQPGVHFRSQGSASSRAGRDHRPPAADPVRSSTSVDSPEPASSEVSDMSRDSLPSQVPDSASFERRGFSQRDEQWAKIWHQAVQGGSGATGSTEAKEWTLSLGLGKCSVALWCAGWQKLAAAVDLPSLVLVGAKHFDANAVSVTCALRLQAICATVRPAALRALAAAQQGQRHLLSRRRQRERAMSNLLRRATHKRSASGVGMFQKVGMLGGASTLRRGVGSKRRGWASTSPRAASSARSTPAAETSEQAAQVEVETVRTFGGGGADGFRGDSKNDQPTGRQYPRTIVGAHARTRQRTANFSTLPEESKVPLGDRSGDTPASIRTAAGPRKLEFAGPQDGHTQRDHDSTSLRPGDIVEIISADGLWASRPQAVVVEPKWAPERGGLRRVQVRMKTGEDAGATRYYSAAMVRIIKGGAHRAAATANATQGTTNLPIQWHIQVAIEQLQFTAETRVSWAVER